MQPTNPCLKAAVHNAGGVLDAEYSDPRPPTNRGPSSSSWFDSPEIIYLNKDDMKDIIF